MTFPAPRVASRTVAKRAFAVALPVLSTALVAGATLAVVACKSRGYNTEVRNTTAVAATTPQEYTACLSIQGNGDKFTAILGEVAAMMERNIRPVFVQGGSSGSLGAVLIRGVASNASVKDAVVTGPDGRTLTQSQKEAIILTTLLGPSETFIFMPSLNRISTVLKTLIDGQLATRFADAFLGTPELELAHVEAIASQGVLVSDFVQNTNFSDVLAEPDFQKRLALTMAKFVKFADLKYVTPKQFITALFSPPPKEGARPTAEQALNEEIKTRYFELFRNEDMRPESQRARRNAGKPDDPKESLANYNKWLSSISLLLKAVPAEKLEEGFLKAASLVTGAPAIGGLAATALKPFYLPSHIKLWNAYNGKTTTGKPLELPTATVLHTTARKTKRRLIGGPLEKTGLENFYMVYYPSRDMFDHLVTLQRNLGPDESFMQYPTASGHAVVLPRNNLLILGPNRTLPQMIKTSIAEPNFMRRDAFQLDKSEMDRNGLTFNESEGETLVSYGGWLDHLSSATFMRYDTCKDVDFVAYATTRNRSQRPNGLHNFQRRAIRAVIDGSPDAFRVARQDEEARDDVNTPVGQFMNHLENYMDQSESMRGKMGKIRLDFDWDNPSTRRGPADDKAEDTRYAAYNKELWNSRSAFFIRSFQHGAKLVDAVLPRESVANVLSPSLLSNDLDKLANASDVVLATEKITGVLVPKK